MTNIVSFTKALGDPTRWRIIRMTMHEPLCVCELADILEMPQSSVSSHVQIIRKADLLESEKCEKWTYFRVAQAYLKILRAMENFFTDAEETEWRRDSARMEQRLEERLGSCCPGPQKLAARKRKAAQAN